jgi:hypothetical protein
MARANVLPTNPQAPVIRTFIKHQIRNMKEKYKLREQKAKIREEKSVQFLAFVSGLGLEGSESQVSGFKFQVSGFPRFSHAS